MTNEWKASNGKYYTKSLFLEIDYDVDIAMYTLKEEDYEYKGKLYKSFKKRYLEIGDPTEYEHSQRLTDNYKHWKQLVGSTHPKIVQLMSECREELEVKLRSQGVAQIASDALEESRTAMTSAKWLADKGWEPKRKAGAPSKAEKKREMKIQTAMEAEIDNIASRLN